MDSESKCDQCFDICLILRMGRIPAVAYFVIGRILSLDNGLAIRQLKWGIADPDSDSSDAEECAGLLCDLNLADDEDTLQTHSTRFTLM
jgi:hypothetical protein